MALTWDELAGPEPGPPVPSSWGASTPATWSTSSGGSGHPEPDRPLPSSGLAARRPGLTHWAISAAAPRDARDRSRVHPARHCAHLHRARPRRPSTRRRASGGARCLPETSDSPTPRSREVWGRRRRMPPRAWRSPADLHPPARLDRRPRPSARPQLDSTAGRYFSLGFGSLLRKPSGAPGPPRVRPDTARRQAFSEPIPCA